MGRRRALHVGVGGALSSAAAIVGALTHAVAQTAPTTATTTTSTPTTSTTTTSTLPVRMPVDPTTAPPPPAPATSPGPTPPPFVVTPPTTQLGDPPPPSLSPDAVASILASLSRSAPSSTSGLLGALRPLQDYGFSEFDAVMMGMGRFPVGGAAYYRDDFGDPRDGPPPHPHMGNDIFAAFDTPVRSPADGRVELSDGGLGGKGVTVTEADGTYYYMAHLNAFAPGLASGAYVTTGQLIGFNGDSGNAKGGAPHVHFEIHPRGGPAIDPKATLDQWLADALAAVPALLAPYQQSIQQGGENSRAIMAVGLARHFERGMLEGPSRLLSKPPELAAPPAQRLADALVEPLTPVLLQKAEVLSLD